MLFLVDKLGCFKRRKLPVEEEEDEFTFQACKSSPTQDNVYQSEDGVQSELLSEKKSLVDNNETNCISSLPDPKNGLPEKEILIDDDE